RLTCGSGFWLVNKACSVIPVFFLLGLGYSTWRRIRAQTCWTTWPQPIPCLSAIQWHARKVSSKPEKDSDGMRLTRGSGF
uniref:Transposase n=1 Tax=Mesocestoides corti TaxID=53468 RepID=A0A5K3F5E3_MESCO